MGPRRHKHSRLVDEHLRYNPSSPCRHQGTEVHQERKTAHWGHRSSITWDVRPVPDTHCNPTKGRRMPMGGHGRLGGPMGVWRRQCGTMGRPKIISLPAHFQAPPLGPLGLCRVVPWDPIGPRRPPQDATMRLKKPNTLLGSPLDKSLPLRKKFAVE